MQNHKRSFKLVKSMPVDELYSVLSSIKFQLEKYKIPASQNIISNLLAYIAYSYVKDKKEPLSINFVYGFKNNVGDDGEHSNIFVRRSYNDSAIDLVEEIAFVDAKMNDYTEILFSGFELDNFTKEEFEHYFEDYFALLSVLSKKQWFQLMGLGRWINIDSATMQQIADGSFIGVTPDWFEEPSLLRHLKNRKFASKWDNANVSCIAVIMLLAYAAPFLATVATVIYLGAYIALVDGSSSILMVEGIKWNYLRTMYPFLLALSVWGMGMISLSVFVFGVSVFFAIPRVKWQK